MDYYYKMSAHCTDFFASQIPVVLNVITNYVILGWIMIGLVALLICSLLYNCKHFIKRNNIMYDSNLQQNLMPTYEVIPVIV